MLHLWLCTDRKANTGRLLESICDNAAKKRGGQILVVPEQFSHTAERLLCRRGGDAISRYAEVLGFSRLASRVFAVEGGCADTETDAGGRLLMMAMAVEQVRSRLKIYGSSAAKPEFLLQMLDTFDELRAFCVTPAALLKAAAQLDGALAAKIEEFALLMESYDAVCANSGQNPESRLTRLLSALETSDFAAGKCFYFDGFSDFNGVETEIIAQLLQSGAEVTVNFTCDSLHGSSQPFETARETAKQLLSIAHAEETAIHILPEKGEQTPLAYLRRHLFSGSAEPFSAPQSAIRRIVAPDIGMECRAAAGEILRLVQEGCRWRDITVACTQEAAYRPILESVFRRAEIPVYFAGSTDILQEPVAFFILSALEAAAEGMEQEAVLACLKSGFSPLEQDRCDRLENYALLWKLSGSRWERPWTMNPYGFQREMDAQARELLEQLNEDRLLAVVPLLHLRDGLRAAKNTGEMVLALNGFMEHIELNERLNTMAERLYVQGDLQRAQEYAQVYGILCNVMEQMYGVLGASIRTPEEFCRIFRTALSQYDIGTIPAKLDCVSVGGLMTQRQSDTKILFLLGANEGSFPAVAENRTLLTDDERLRLVKTGVGVSLTAAQQLDRELMGVYCVLSAPQERLYLSALEGKEAYLFRRAGKLFPDATETATDTALICRAPREYLTYLASSPDGVSAARENAPDLTERAAQIAGAQSYSFGALSPDTVQQLYGKTLRLSSSKIDTLASCRFAYYLEYGLRARDRKTAELDAPLYGTFVHDVLEHTARQVQQEGGFSKVPPERVMEIAQKRMETYAESELADLWESERAEYLFRRTFDEVRQVVRELYDELSRSAFEPRWFELEFSAQGTLPAVRIVGQSAVAELEGFVDRADIWRHGEKTYVRVVDYKTGKKEFDYTGILNGVGLQMLLYLFTLEQAALPEGKLEPCGVLYFPARIERVSLPDRFSDLENQRRKNLRRRGLLLDSEPVLRAMEQCEDKPVYLPYTVDKEGNRVGDLASREQFSLLKKHVFSTVAALADELYAGTVAPNPYFRDPSHNACRWCPYASVCGEQMNRRWLKKLESPAEFWQELEGKQYG